MTNIYNYLRLVPSLIVISNWVVLRTMVPEVVLRTGPILSKREKRKRSESLFLYAECRGFFSSASAKSRGGVTKQKRAGVEVCS